MTPTEYLAVLQAESDGHGFHKELGAWVDDHSGVARALRALEERNADDLD